MSFNITKEDERRSREVFEARRAGKPSAATASTPRVKRLLATIADIERKRGPAPATAPKPKQYPPGPKTREAAKLVEALKRARRGDIGQALGVEQVDVHKLPPHVTYG